MPAIHTKLSGMLNDLRAAKPADVATLADALLSELNASLGSKCPTDVPDFDGDFDQAINHCHTCVRNDDLAAMRLILCALPAKDAKPRGKTTAKPSGKPNGKTTAKK